MYCHAYYYNMQQSDQQFWHIARAFLIRYNQYNREKGVYPAVLEEFDHAQARLLSSQQLKQAAINKLTSLECKSDYHNLILLAFLQDLAKWSSDYHSQLSSHPAPLEAILTQTLQVLSSQQQFHTIVAKQNQLISALLPLPFVFGRLDQFKVLYRRLKDVKEYFPSSIREHQKKCFLTAVEETVDRASKVHNIKVIEYIFTNIFSELQAVDEKHELVNSRLKIVKKICKLLWTFHEDIIFKISYLLMKFSYHLVNSPHLYSHLLPIYVTLLPKLLDRPSLAPLLVFRHLILNNIEKLLKTGSSCLMLQGLLSELSRIFTSSKLCYFMCHYDWNYLQVGICQQSLHLLYEYSQNRSHEKKVQYQLVKACLNRIHSQIKKYLEDIKTVRKDEKKWKFYEVKKKEYQELVKEMNESPKKIFKTIDHAGSQEVKESLIHKYARIIHKSCDLENKSMIGLLGADNATSAQLFSAYAELLLQQCREHNLQQFMRMFTSNFFLTGESQQIARILDTITKFYYDKQEEGKRILKSSDATYTFANAILILNTDLHNPKNEEKISEESFLKMCKKINEGEDLDNELLRRTYYNIKKNKMNTFRNRADMLGISANNWLLLCLDYDSLQLKNYDPQLEALDQSCLNYFIKDVLSGIIDQKQTAKLQILVERFSYDDKIFQCEVIQAIRKAIDKKPHLPLHIIEKIFELANFKHTKPCEKTLSYYWLVSQIITNFPQLVPPNIICQLLVMTWDIRIELQDNMQLRQNAEVRRIRQSIKNVQKREAKKSIMDMFSNFLSFKQSQDQAENTTTQFSKRNNFKAISNNLLTVLKSRDSSCRAAIEFLMGYIHQEQSKVYQQFLGCLFLTFNLLYNSPDCQQGQDLFYELLGVKESSITKRLAALAKKDQKLFNVLNNYCHFWILKILLKEYALDRAEKRENNSFRYMLDKSLPFLEKVDQEILTDFIRELIDKKEIHPELFAAFEKGIQKANYPDKHPEANALLEKFSPKIKQENSQQMVQQITGDNSRPLEEVPAKNLPVQQTQKADDENKQMRQEVIKQQQLIEQTSKKSSSSLKVESQGQIESQQNVSSLPRLPQGHLQSKKCSMDNLEEYVNPDAMMQQIDREIESHLAQKAEELETKKEEEEQARKETTEGQQQDIKKGKQEESKEEQAPSIPVIMF